MDERRHWHLDKRLNIGHMLTTVIIASGVFIWASKIDTRVEINTIENIHTRKMLELQQAHLSSEIREVKRGVEALNKKVDQLMKERRE